MGDQGDRFRSQILGFCSALLLLAAGGAKAQSNAEVNAGVQFNFSTPGARSLGLGGAFLGLADDATAAYANPAGLTVLSDPEISFEIRNWGFHNTFTQGGRTVGTPTGRGIDTVAGLVEGTDEETVTGLSFLSAVYPGRNWAVALYRHELASYQASFRTQGTFVRNDIRRTAPQDHQLDLDITGLGLSGAIRLGDRFSVGAGIVSYDFSMLSRTHRYRVQARTNPATPGETEPGGFFGPPLYTPENLVDTQVQTGEDRQIGFNAGFQYKVVPGWTLGVVYRQGPAFDLDAVYIRGPVAPDPGPVRVTRPARYDVPEVLGAGVAYQPTELLTFTLDYVYVDYSDLTNGIVDIILLQPDVDLSLEAPFFKADDAGEIHLGFERILRFRSYLVAARAGTWYDPEHRIRYEGELAALRAAFRPGEDQTHVSAGFGFIVPRWKFRTDLALDYSHPVTTASISTVLYF